MPPADSVRKFAAKVPERRAAYQAAMAKANVNVRGIIAERIHDIAALVAEGFSYADIIERLGLPISDNDLTAARQRPELKRILDDAKAALGHRTRKRTKYLADNFDRILELIAGGRTIEEALATDERFPTAVMFSALLRDHPNLARRVDLAQVQRAQVRSVNQLSTALNQNGVYLAAKKAVPRWLPPTDRDDVIADIAVALLERGEIPDAETLKEMGLTMTAKHVKRNGRSFYAVKSTDEKVFDNDEKTVGDSIPNSTDIVQW